MTIDVADVADVAEGAGVPYRDRRAALICVGAVEIALGLLALLFLCLLDRDGLRSTTIAEAPLVGLRLPVPRAALYLMTAVGFGWLGVGSAMARRWARALMLIAAYFWLAGGVIVALRFSFSSPAGPALRALLTRSATLRAGGVPGAEETGLAALSGCFVAVLALFWLVLPLFFVLFYGSRHVKATCEARDPRPRWTDRLPLPALALVPFAGAAALLLLSAAGYRVLPICGVVLGGPPAVALALLLAALFAFTARGAWRLDPRAWWAAAALTALGAASALVTAFDPFDWNDLRRHLGINAREFADLGGVMLSSTRRFPWLTCLGIVPWLGYVAWLARYFFASRPAGVTALEERADGREG